MGAAVEKVKHRGNSFCKLSVFLFLFTKERLVELLYILKDKRTISKK